MDRNKKRNKIMKYIVYFTIVTSILILTSCTQTNNIDDVRNIVNIIKPVRFNPNIANNEIDKYIYKMDEKDVGISKEKLDLLLDLEVGSNNELYDGNKQVAKGQALEDVEDLFKLYKYSYAPYAYFGGDETFNKVKLNIIQAIENYKNDFIAVKDLEDILISNLSFIEDAHFFINNYYFCQKKFYFYSEQYEFLQDKSGYFTVIDNKKYYINTIDEHSDYTHYLKKTFNENGELVYNLGITQSLVDYERNQSITVELYNETDQKYIVKKIKLKQATYFEPNTREIFDQKIENNIPVITMRSMIQTNENIELDEFIKTVDIIKSYPVSIIDIRWNPGGQDILPMEWFYSFTGKQPERLFTGATLYSKVNKHIARRYLQNIDIENASELIKQQYEREIEKLSSDSNHWEISYGDYKKVENNNLILVLMDAVTASSAESFVEFLYPMDNVIFIGTNTGGAARSCTYTVGRLINSKINFGFGNFVSFFDDKIFDEGIGFLPDIWIGNDQTLERTLLFLKRNMKNNLD